MTTSNVASRRRKASKPSTPAKPRRDFPLFAHRNGQWAKKVRGKIFYFGTWDDPIAAEKKWERDKEALLDGRNPDESRHGDSIGWACNCFMDSKQLQHDRGELTKRALDDYHRACKHVAAFFGKGRRLDSLRSPDIERYRNSLPDTWGPTTTNNHLRLVRVFFKYINDAELCDRPIRYSIGLKAVPKSVVRKDRAKRDAKEFSVDEIHRLLEHASVPMRAFILLGLNCGFGTTDIARLRIDAIDFDGAEVDFVFQVENPNPIQVELASFSYGLSLAETPLFDGDNADGFTLEASNASEPGRAQNRRIEIVVVPDLSELPGYDELSEL